jgi:chromosome segregation ATPase
MRFVYILPLLFLTIISWAQPNKVKKLQNKIDNLEIEIEQLKTDKTLRDEIIASRNKEILDLKKEISSAPSKETLAKKELIIDSLKTIINSSKGIEKSPNSDQKLKEMEQELSQLKKELDQSKAAEKKKDSKLQLTTAELANLKTQLSNAQAKVKKLEEELAKANEVNARLEAKNKGLEAQISEQDKSLAKVKGNLAAQQSANKENDILKKALFADITKEVKEVMKSADYITTLPKVTALESKIEEQKKLHPNRQETLNTYNLELGWYKDYANTLTKSIQLLDSEYDLEKVVKTKTQLEHLKKSTNHSSTEGQNKNIDAQIKLLDAYCGKYNYAVNKFEDANSFAKNKGMALEEINAALKRVEKEYTFLHRKLNQRKKDPTNSEISLTRVTCP